MIRVSSIVSDTIVDGPGIRLAVYVQGCGHNCIGCHNAETHDFSGGTEMTTGEILDRLNPLITGVTLTGGDPLEQAGELISLARSVKEKGLNLWLYTGYRWEEILQNKDHMELLQYVDVLVDGRFEQEKRSLSARFRGSTNQRLIDVPRSLLCPEAPAPKHL